ncbi:mechanosensitive ion channel family protein [Undibacter mobilis]|uniref:Mechanosensitive ion channel protein MscS n=1 Tax=Undibacter mobilis TaxID=2292256 RepID=A0A371BAL7_9BRAD|nr:mechanosensitive ion channel domain-containing protein [Undibacter mobilis]RDV04401.1 mechanosensitive ion channel protein MscS [Undibacter mobilis]
MDNVQGVVANLSGTLHNLVAELSSFWLLVQFGILLVAGFAGALAGATIRRRVDLDKLGASWPPLIKLLAKALLDCIGTILFIAIAFIAREAMLSMTWPSRSYLVGVAVSLATAWVVIALVTSLIRNQFIHRVVSIAAWTFAALDIVGLRSAVRAELDAYAVMFGGLRISALLVIKGTVLLLIALWIANALSDFMDRRIKSEKDLTPSVQVLISKMIRILLIAFAIITVLSSVGIDLSALAFFSGAIGVGLGFGLQKIVSNFVSGIILLADKSIKPGDVISVGEHFGRVGIMGARYTSVDTRDGREYLIPNEDFITQRVANWSYSSDLVRLSVKFNTTYDSDPRKAQAAAVEAAQRVDRVVQKPTPQCMLTAFGSTSIEYEMWFWIRDPAAGIINVRSDVLLALWDTLAHQGVTIPKPGPARVIYELAREDEPDPPKDQDDTAAPKSPFPG